MKKKIFITTGIVILLIASAMIWWNIPSSFLKSTDTDDISCISVRNGHTGNHFDITDKDDIAYITDNIKKHSFDKSSVSLFHMGTWYTLSFYNKNDSLIDEFILNSGDTIRKDPFFYRTEKNSMDNLTEFLAGCEADSTFSFAEAASEYNGAGIVTSGFKNTTPVSIENDRQVLEHAKNECTITYNKTKVRYDADTDMWWVHFSTKDTLGGDQSVYMDGAGITKLLVYGE